MNEIASWTATEVARGIRAGAISSAEAVAACLERVEEVNGTINAVVEVDAENAERAAVEADRAVRDGAALAPLHGVPVAIKINTNQIGFANNNGVTALRDLDSTENDPQVKSWLDAGAISVGRTNSPAFSFRYLTENELFGTTRNPWDLERSPGGSSGGAAAALAAGMCFLAQGNDIGGSIRYPAACCGVTGIRPTVGRIPGWYGSVEDDPLLSVQIFLVQGPLARTIEDLRLGLAAMESPDSRDPWSVPVTSEMPDLDRPIRVGIVANPGGSFTADPSPEVRESLDLAASWLSDAGYQVEEADVPQLGEAARLWWKVGLTEAKLFLAPRVEEQGDPTVKHFLAGMLEAGDEDYGEVDLPDYISGYARRASLIRELEAMMAEMPILLTPMSARPPYRLGEDQESVQRVREIMSEQWPCQSVPLLGLPGLSVPAQVSGGLPIGVQLVGRRFREDTLFDAAEVIEARSGLRTPVEPVKLSA